MPNEFVTIYVDFLRKHLALHRALKVVFDFSNGTTELIVPLVIKGVQQIRPIFVDRTLSGNFPAHGPNPLAPRAIAHLHKEVLRHRADLGVIFDADGDRAFFVDHRGRWVPTHAVAYLLALETHPPYIFDTRTSLALTKAGIAIPGPSYVSPVGAIFVKQLMRKTNAGLGAEYSGHYCFDEFFQSDSGIFAAVKIMNALSRLPYTFADFVDLIPSKLEDGEMNISSADPSAIMQRIVAHFRTRALSIKKFDGVTLDFGAWFLNIRPSNTEPLLRFFAGSHDRSLLQRKFKELHELLAGTH